MEGNKNGRHLCCVASCWCAVEFWQHYFECNINAYILRSGDGGIIKKCLSPTIVPRHVRGRGELTRRYCSRSRRLGLTS